MSALYICDVKQVEMKRYFLGLLIGIGFFTLLHAQDVPVIRLNHWQIEKLFLEQNLQLIAEQYNIELVDAAIIQAKVWENPSLSVSQLNLWSTEGQREGVREVIPPLFGEFGRNMEFSVELSQLIYTAGKRSKLIKRENVSKEIAEQEFAEVLRGLKSELSKTIYETYYSQSYLQILTVWEESLSGLIESYRKQLVSGNIARTELLRLESSLLELENEKNEVQVMFNGQQRTLKVLLNLDSYNRLEIDREEEGYPLPENIVFSDLLQLAYEHRPDIKMARLQEQYFEKSIRYERSMRVPDVTVGMNYDRYGGVWRDFIGFGVSVDLPFFNRNQGNIKASEVGKEQSRMQAVLLRNVIENEVAEAFLNYKAAYDFNRKISSNPLLSELDRMMDVYTRNFQTKNISALEYVDFIEAYKSNMHTILTVRKNLDIYWSELQYVINASLTAFESENSVE